MTITLNDDTATTSDDLYDFARTHVDFATFHPEHRFDDIRLELHVNGPAAVGCCLATNSKNLGQFELEAVAEDAFDAIAHAASLLGEEVDRRIERFERTRRASEKRSRPAGRIPLSAAAPAPSPAATNWGAIR